MPSRLNSPSAAKHRPTQSALPTGGSKWNRAMPGPDCQKTQESSRGPQPFRPGSARLHLLPLFHKKGSANIQRGHGTVFASENPIFQRKKRFLAGSAPEKSSIFSGDWRGWQWRGSLLPRPPACQNFFDKLAGAFAPERLQGNYGSVQMSRRSKRPNARCFLALPKRKGGWSSHP